MAASIDKVVILFLENHTVDNMASEVAGVDGDRGLPPVALQPDGFLLPDPPHDHRAWMSRAQKAVRKRFTRAQLPNLYALMDAFTTCDAYFSDYAGNSFPNHCFAIGADAEWAWRNPRPGSYDVTIQNPGLPVRLDGAGRSWANYGDGFAFKHYADARMHANVVPDSNRFLADAAAGKLPDVSWVYGPGGLDFHAGEPAPKDDGSSMPGSDQWLGRAVQAIADGPHWSTTMAFVTFDDWGGWADHVDPPNVEQFPAGGQFPGEQYRYGSRVPCVVVGPYAKPAYVSHARSSHVSLVAYVERLWGLPASPSADAARRTAADTAMADCYDLEQAPNAPPKLPAGVAAGPAPRPASRHTTH